jgi:AraC family transcriptional regulator
MRQRTQLINALRAHLVELGIVAAQGREGIGVCWRSLRTMRISAFPSMPRRAECGHDHSCGDRCIALHFDLDYFAEVAASVGGAGQFKFRAGILPSGPASLSWLARTQSLIAQGNVLAVGESVAEIMEFVVAASSGSVPSPQRVSAADERRISATLHLLERYFYEAIDLDHLAKVAAMSKYHFLRTFRRIVGVTPYQYLLGLRLRRAAFGLTTSSKPISAIAFETGFRDLSTFNERFRRQFGTVSIAL